MKLLHIGLFNEKEPQISLRMALEEISEVYVEYPVEPNIPNMTNLLTFNRTDFDVVFLHVQGPNIVPVDAVRKLHKMGVKVFNFTGDVRRPLPQWYLQLGPYVTTLFTNLSDVEIMRNHGFDAHYFQVGYNTDFYNMDIPKRQGGPEIVFMGNNYGSTFPLGPMRKEMITRLKKKYGDRFAVYGFGWGKEVADINHNYFLEASTYRGCKIAISLSHFDLKRYASDRLFRILACGAFCLSHKFKEIEKEFENGKHLVWWKDLDELERLIDEYLKKDEERERIGKAGNKHCEANYTWPVRMKQLLELI